MVELPGRLVPAEPEGDRARHRFDVLGRPLLATAVDRLGLTGRAHDRVLKVAPTIADLTGAERVGRAHLAEALQFRR